MKLLEADMNAQEIIQKAIPDADAALCEHIVWEMTHFPFAPVDARMLYKAASRFKRANDNGRRLCDWCDHEAIDGERICPKCKSALS